jgi:hypothetical protein
MGYITTSYKKIQMRGATNRINGSNTGNSHLTNCNQELLAQNKEVIDEKQFNHKIQQEIQDLKTKFDRNLL